MAKKGKHITVDQYDPNADYNFEKVSGESMTEPDQAYTVAELMARHVWPSDLERPVHWGEEDEQDFDMPDMSKIAGLDLHDKLELFRDLEDRAKAAQDAIDRQIVEDEKEAVEQLRKVDEASGAKLEQAGDKGAASSSESSAE